LALIPGTRVGPYEIGAQIGVGGMGEVYRARDTKLNRDVAIKTLLPAVADDPDRLARFTHEAQFLASLSHPNIAAIYGLEESDGVKALVLEVVEGPTLTERIGARGLPASEAIAIARQIAEALDAAHEKGIVHRDLKPANVKVTPGGVVKVLDFGLAKHVVAAAQASQVETTFVHTRDGALLGTVGYMSPEQARGHEVDKRADIWAFGCVLFELVSGRRAFEGATATDTLAAIVQNEPDWTVLPSDTPTAVRRLLQRCLAKDPRRRLRDIGEASTFFDEASDVSPTAPVTTNERARSHRSRRIALIAAGLTALIAAAMLWRTGASVPTDRLSLGAITPFTFDPGMTADPSLSADGRLIAYASNRGAESNLDIFVQQTTGGAAIRLTDDAADDHEPDVSPDGSLVAFRSERAPPGVYVASALGGTARLIAPDGRAPRFSPDGRFVAFEIGTSLAPIAVINTRKIFVVPAAGGAPTQVARNLVNAGGPTWAPDGKSLLALGRKGRSPTDVALDWWHVPVDADQPAVRTGVFDRLARGGFRLDANTVTIPYPRVWTADGVFFSATTGGGDSLNLWHIAVDAIGRPLGGPVRLTQGTTLDYRAALSRDGRVAWVARTLVTSHLGFPIDAATGQTRGEPRKLHDDSAPSGRPAISIDGRLLIFARYDIASGILWAKDLQTGEERQLVATPRTPLNPAISRDAQWVGYTLTKIQTGGDAGLGDGYVLQTTGGVQQKVCENCEVSTWTPDGQLVFNTASRNKLERVNVRTGERRDLIDAPSAVDRPLFGPDGKWVIFNVDGRIIHAPVHSDRAVLQSDWTTVMKIGPTERTAGISPDGGLLYVLLESDGFRCVYGLKLDRRTGLPQGEAFPVVHVHNATWRWGSTGYGSAVGNGLFVAQLYESRGNIWMSQLVRGDAVFK
jgi:serine/threonine protein kinase/Tol biopolymer transport system component